MATHATGSLADLTRTMTKQGGTTFAADNATVEQMTAVVGTGTSGEIDITLSIQTPAAQNTFGAAGVSDKSINQDTRQVTVNISPVIGSASKSRGPGFPNVPSGSTTFKLEDMTYTGATNTTIGKKTLTNADFLTSSGDTNVYLRNGIAYNIQIVTQIGSAAAALATRTVTQAGSTGDDLALESDNTDLTDANQQESALVCGFPNGPTLDSNGNAFSVEFVQDATNKGNVKFKITNLTVARLGTTGEMPFYLSTGARPATLDVVYRELGGTAKTQSITLSNLTDLDKAAGTEGLETSAVTLGTNNSNEDWKTKQYKIQLSLTDEFTRTSSVGGDTGAPYGLTAEAGPVQSKAGSNALPTATAQIAGNSVKLEWQQPKFIGSKVITGYEVAWLKVATTLTDPTAASNTFAIDTTQAKGDGGALAFQGPSKDTSFPSGQKLTVNTASSPALVSEGAILSTTITGSQYFDNGSHYLFFIRATHADGTFGAPNAAEYLVGGSDNSSTDNPAAASTIYGNAANDPFAEEYSHHANWRHTT